MLDQLEELYFARDTDFYDWLLLNHDKSKGIHVIFYKLETNIPTMRWEEAVRVALCFGWIDSTVKSLGNGKRKQYFCPRNPKGVWSAVNKKHVKELIANNLMQESGLKMIALAKKTGTWTAMDAVEKGIIQKNVIIIITRERAFDFERDITFRALTLKYRSISPNNLLLN